MAKTVHSRKKLILEPIVIIGLGLCPALAAARGLRESAMLVSGILMVQILTIGFLLPVRRFMIPALTVTLVFVVTVAGGFAAGWIMLCKTLAPEVFSSINFFAYLTPVMLPVLYIVKWVRRSPSDQVPALKCIGIALYAGAALLAIGAIREIIGSGALFGKALLSGPVFSWVQTVPGGLTVSALVLWLAGVIVDRGPGRKKETAL
jgi:Na+-translocating ferredoxin:NAD+ oxidoreductase subunit E